MKDELRKRINEDTFRYFGEEKRSGLYRLGVQALQYTIVLRKVQYHSEHRNRIRYLRYKTELSVLSRCYFIQIPASTRIGRGLYIGHMGSVVVNEHAVLGDNVNLSVGVTIGQTNRGPMKGSPTLGNSVWVGTNAVLVGGITVGNNVLIAPNAYCNIDVPSDSIVIGNPATITRNERATDGYVQNQV